MLNAIERAKILADEDLIQLENLPTEVTHAAPNSIAMDEHKLDLASINRGVVVEAMRREQGNKLRAAKSLGVSRRSLYRLLEKYHIREEEYAS